MPMTNSRIRGVDLPLWEWLHPATLNGAASRLASSVTTTNVSSRYNYVLIATTNGTRGFNFDAYDTYLDGWKRAASDDTVNNVATTAHGTDATTSTRLGYTFRAVAATSNTVSGALLDGDRLLGATIRIVEGTGAGQVRTITALDAPTVHDFGGVTLTSQSTATSGFIQDGQKSWTLNQWAGYQLRINNAQSGSVSGVARKILYNTGTNLYYADTAWSSVSPYEWGWWYRNFPAAGFGGGPTYQIESIRATINTPWTVQPDITSQIMCETGLVIGMHTSSTGGPQLFYFDVASATMVNQACSLDVGSSGSSDGGLVAVDYYQNPYFSGSAGATSTAASVVAQGTPNWTAGRWVSSAVRITGGTGIGQMRTIKTSSTNTLEVTPRFMTTPDGTSTFEIIPDYDKMWYQRTDSTGLMQYSFNAQQWYRAPLIDYGVTRSFAAVRGTVDNPLAAFAISSITRSGTTATATTSNSHNFRVGDTVTISGASAPDAALYNITTAVTSVPSSTTFTYTMAGTPTASAAAIGTPSGTLMIDCTKNWTVNEHVGKVLTMFGTAWTTGRSEIANHVITANTATTITITGASFTMSANNRYAILDNRLFGTDTKSNTPAYGQATSGSTTTVVDTTKNWRSGEHINKTVVIWAGSGRGQTSSISGNTATTLTLASTQSTAIDSTSVYSIVDGSTAYTGAHPLMWLSNTTKLDKGRYLFQERASSNYLLYDITTNSYSKYLNVFDKQMLTASASDTSHAYDGQDTIYISAFGRFVRFNLATMQTEILPQMPYMISGLSAGQGQKMTVTQLPTGEKYLYAGLTGFNQYFRLLLEP